MKHILWERQHMVNEESSNPLTAARSYSPPIQESERRAFKICKNSKSLALWDNVVNLRKNSCLLPEKYGLLAFSLRLGHAQGLKAIQAFIQDLRAASLPSGGRWHSQYLYWL